MSVHFHPLRITSVERDAESVLLDFQIDETDPAMLEAFRYRAGQYLTLRAEVDGEDLRRNYSICSAPQSARLRVAIRQVPGGRFSSWAMSNLQSGQVLQVLPPDGRFVLQARPDARRHVVCIAAGSGITPMMAILQTLLRDESHSRATLIYGNRRLASTMFRDELTDLKNRYLGRLAVHHVFSREAQEIELFNGRLDSDRVAQFLQTLVPSAGIDDAYVCGPAQMIEASCEALRQAGVPDRQVHVERFGDGLPALPAAAQASVPGDADHARVLLVIDGLEREIEVRRSDASILDAALRCGLELPFACKAGVCSTCRGRVLEGEVRMDRNFALSAEELEQGFVLCCQAHPQSAQLRITLDQR